MTAPEERTPPGERPVASLPGARPAALPGRLAPQLAFPARAAPEGEEWLHEIKLDGYRLIGRVDRGRTTLLTRRGRDWTHRFAGIARALAALPLRTALLDGEVVVFDAQGRSRLAALTDALSAGRDPAFVLQLFDVVHLDGYDLHAVPLRLRKEALAGRLAAREPADAIRYTGHVMGRGGECLDGARDLGLEGIVSKRVDSPYRPGQRMRDWVKIACRHRAEAVVVGFMPSTAADDRIGSLLLARPDREGRLRYAGRVGTGYDAATRRALLARLLPIERERAPVADAPRGRELREARWVEPRLVAAVEIVETTRDGRLRGPSFQGLLEDREPADVEPTDPVELGEPEGTEAQTQSDPGERAARPRRRGREASIRIGRLRLTSPGRVLYERPRLTKLDIAAYYATVAERMLPHLAGRPLTLLRCPEGVDGDCFFQKHGKGTEPAPIRSFDATDETGRVRRLLAVDDQSGLLALVQLAVLEVHVWGARLDRLDRPDRLVLDLDPADDVAFDDVAAAARELRDRLDAFGLRAHALLTGGKGLHLVVPLRRRHAWDVVKGFARAFAETAARREPRRFVARAAKDRRAGRIYIDWLRNARGATAICPYSTRARAGAPIAAPIRWDELDAVGPGTFTAAALPRWIAAHPTDPWEGFAARRGTIDRSARRAVGAPT